MLDVAQMQVIRMVAEGDRAIGIIEMPDIATGEQILLAEESLIHDGKVDVEALANFGQSSNPEIAATAYFLAGKHESDYGNFTQAKRYYESALRFRPDYADAENNLGILLAGLPGRLPEAS